MTEDVTDIHRLGPSNSDIGKVRPLLIKCSSKKIKWETIKGTKDIKYLDDNNVSHPILFRPGLTIKQRDRRKQMIKELNQHKENGVADLIIKNNRTW